TWVIVRWRVESCSAKQPEKSVGECLRFHTSFQTLLRKVVIGELAQNPFILETGRKFDFAKLHRLKTAGWIQFVTKTEEPQRTHRLENMNLRYQQLFDLNHAA